MSNKPDGSSTIPSSSQSFNIAVMCDITAAHTRDELEQSPRAVLDDNSSTYDYLPHTLDMVTLRQRRVQTMLYPICALISRSAKLQARIILEGMQT